MRSLANELKRIGLVADLDKFEEIFMEDDRELTPIQRRLILRRFKEKQQDKEDSSADVPPIR